MPAAGEIMRVAVNIVAGLTGLLTAGLVGYWALERGREEVGITRATQAVERLNQQIKLRAATAGAALNTRGWPATVDPAWFGDDPPMNPLVTPARPWVEVAPPEHAALRDPQIRATIEPSHAAFWYNPYLGVVRARVPLCVSDRQTTALYNRVNAAHITEVIDTEPVPPPPTPANVAGGPTVEPAFPSEVDPSDVRADAVGGK